MNSAKSYIQLGIFSVIYFFLYFSITAFAAISPILIVPLAPIAVIIAAIPFMLFIRRIHQFGLITLMALLLALTAVLLGDYPLTLLSALIAGSIADSIALLARRRKQATLNYLAYSIFALWQSGAFLPFLFLHQSIIKDIEQRFGAEYANNIAAIFQPLTIVSMLCLVLIAGFIGAIIANKLINKHFARAGHA